MGIAYGLRADYEGTVTIDGVEQPRYSGGVVRVVDRDLDIRQELEAGGGQIVVDETDFAAINVLDGYPALKRVSAGDAPVTASRYAAMTVAELREEASRRDLDTSGVKADLVARLEANDDAVQEGDAALAADPTPEDGVDPQPDTTPEA